MNLTILQIDVNLLNCVRINRKYIGKTLDVLVDGPGKNGEGTLTGKSSEYIIVNFAGDASLTGRFVKVKITGVDGDFCIGEPV